MRKVYRCREDITREFLTESIVMNARFGLEGVINALYWRKRTMDKDIIIPNISTISSWLSKMLRGVPSDWMLREIMKKKYLVRRYGELQAERLQREREKGVHRTL